MQYKFTFIQLALATSVLAAPMPAAEPTFGHGYGSGYGGGYGGGSVGGKGEWSFLSKDKKWNMVTD